MLFFLFVIPIQLVAQDLSVRDVALIDKVFYLQNALGKKVWKNWELKDVPFLYKTAKYDFIINHFNPPGDFKIFYSKSLKKLIGYRNNYDSINYQATFEINGINTVVMSAPDTSFEPCLWVLKAAHELFHIYQNKARPKNPFQRQYAKNNDLNFPFNYKDESIAALGQIEAIYIFDMLK
jgi:hypothetical protein